MSDPDGAAALRLRALPANAPHGYMPQVMHCPSISPSVRDAGTLSDQERSWLQARRNATVEPMVSLLTRANITGFDAMQYIQNYTHNPSVLPNIGIAMSGGGYRAMLIGAGVIEAFDNRTTNATGPGQLGGLLQAATYLSSLSGGSWLVGSLYANNFTSVRDILTLDTSAAASGDLWQFGQTIYEGPRTNGTQLLGSVGYYADLLSAVQDKANAGFNTTITDYWGRALSYQLVNATDGGPDYTFSSIAKQDWFTSGTAPLPVIVVNGRAPGETVVSTNATVFDISPWELGSPDPTLYAYAPLQYVGTSFSAGSPVANDSCVSGFDNVGFVFGTSSSLFNAILTTVNVTNTTGVLNSAIQSSLVQILGKIGNASNDIADWVNPFYNYNNNANQFASSVKLTLVDGGEDLENIPFHPLIQPERHVDVIFGVEVSADTNGTWPTNSSASGWPNGASIAATYQRSLSPISNHTVFPRVPDINTFINQGLASRPTFFGCDAANLTGPSPLIVYLPNGPYVYNANTSTFDLQYNNTERNAMILNGYNLATQGNATLDKEWPACVGCAILSRSFNRTGTAPPDVCVRCFQRYCWNGIVNATQPGNYILPMKLPNDVVKVTASVGAKATLRPWLVIGMTILLGSLL